MIERAVLFAAGRGARLGEITATTPKPLLTVGGRPVIVRALDGFARAGIREVVVVTGYLGEQVEAELGNGEACGMRLSYVRQATPDGTAKALLLARDALGEGPFAWAWADIVVPSEAYRAVVRAALADGALAVNEVDDPAEGAAVYVADGFVTRIVEKPAPGSSTTRWNNAGVGVLGPAAWEHVAALEPSPRGEYELPRAIAAMVAAGARLRAVPVEGPWSDIGTPASLAAAREHYARRGA
ncbi:MAG: nucleotidyltransferase family protein [Dehalococcoidia bacterium]|nr:nucleotidyltransferase family protein [Dehalococcoidia bacterium]